MSKIIRTTSTIQDKFISISWRIATICNYNCSYCGDPKIKPFKDYEGFFNFVEDVKKKYPDKEVILQLLGGEVTIWNKFVEFLTKCNEKSIKISVITNGSPSVEWWKKNIDKMTYVLISYHYEHSSKKHFREIAPIVRHKASILLMTPPDKFDEIIEFGKQLSSECKIVVVPKFILDVDGKPYPYTDE